MEWDSHCHGQGLAHSLAACAHRHRRSKARSKLLLIPDMTAMNRLTRNVLFELSADGDNDEARCRVVHERSFKALIRKHILGELIHSHINLELDGVSHAAVTKGVLWVQVVREWA